MSIILAVVFVVTLFAFATPWAPSTGYYGMMGNTYSGNYYGMMGSYFWPGMLFGGLICILIIVALVVFIFWMVDHLTVRERRRR